MTNTDRFFNNLFPEKPNWEEGLNARLKTSVPWNQGLLVVGWELQAKASTVTLLGLLAFVSIWGALAVMLVWSLTVTFVYYQGRKRSFPDLLEHSKPDCGREKSKFLGWVAISAAKVWFGGMQENFFLQTTCKVRRLDHFRPLLIGVSLVYFGVTANHHLLRKSGFSGEKILALTVLGSILNTTFRIVLGTGMLNISAVIYSYIADKTTMF